MLERIAAHAPVYDPQGLVERLIRLLDKVIYGKTELIRTLLTAVVAGGHVLLEDVPGVGKTRLIKALPRRLLPRRPNGKQRGRRLRRALERRRRSASLVRTSAKTSTWMIFCRCPDRVRRFSA